MIVDIGRQLKFPVKIIQIQLRHDKQVSLELTVPWEENMDEATKENLGIYLHIVEEFKKQGWQAQCKPIEIGCRGFKSSHYV